MPNKRSPAGGTSGGRQRLTAVQRAERARSIAAAHASGQTWAQVAAEHGLSRSSARRIAREVRDGGDPSARDVLAPGDPLSPIRSLVARLDWAAEMLEGLATNGDNSSAKVGAVRASVAVEVARVQTFQALGVTPTNVAAPYNEHITEEIVRDVIEALRRHGALDAAVEVLEVRRKHLKPTTGGTLHAA